MKIVYYIILSIGLSLFSCAEMNSDPGELSAEKTSSVSKNISPDVFEQKSNDPAAQIVDVRTTEEYSGGYITGAVNMNISGSDFEIQLGGLDKNRPVMVYCLSGGRSASAMETMIDIGFKEVYNLEGGLMKWIRAGKPVFSPDKTLSNDEISETDFEKEINSMKLVLVDYNAKWCEPCKKMAPMLEKVAEAKKENLKLFKIDADKNKLLLKNKGIEELPVLELYMNGKLIWKHEGIVDEAGLLKQIKL